MSDAALHVPLAGPPVSRTPTLSHECTVAGIRMMALPPGSVEIALVHEWHGVNFVPAPMGQQVMRLGGTDFSARNAPKDSVSWHPAGMDMHLKCVNEHWETLIEIDPARADALAHESMGTRTPTGEFVYWQHDPLVAAPSTLLIHHLREPDIDPLYAEGLAVTVAARALRMAGGGLDAPSTRGTDARITRAIDYAEARLDRSIPLAGMAGVAAMSPYHFLRCFRDATGEPPARWVQRRRVERAKALLRGPMPLAQIAHACGFASQSHFGEVFKAHVGASPGAWRASLS